MLHMACLDINFKLQRHCVYLILQPKDVPLQTTKGFRERHDEGQQLRIDTKLREGSQPGKA